MDRANLLKNIQNNLEEVVKQSSPLGEALWGELVKMHPVDIVDFLSNIDKQSAMELFTGFPKSLRNAVFEEFSIPEMSESLNFLDEPDKVEVLRALGTDELTDLFDYFSDEDLKKYLRLLHKKEREKVISLLKFHKDSAGGIMDIDVLSLMPDFTVEKTVHLLQRLKPRQEINRELYVTDNGNRLIGHINLEDLLMHPPQTRVSSFLRENELVAQADEDQEIVAKKMIHYGLMTVPVVGKENYFLGVIPSETLVDVIVQEADEDVQKMAALSPVEHTYVAKSFWMNLYQRGNILVVLMLVESISSIILRSYERSLGSLIIFVTMLMSTGGNTSHQTSTLVVRGMASGEITKRNAMKFLKREILTALGLALILGTVAFVRAYFTVGKVLDSVSVGLTIGITVMVAVVLGSFIPLALKKMNIDPAFSAGPFLATLMDIVSVAIFCIIVYMLLT